MFDISLYNDEFFEWHHIHARQYSIESIKPVIEYYEIKSVIDFGCGIGSYLEGAYQLGLTDLRGFDIGGKYAEKYTPETIKPFIGYTDITNPISCKKYDLVISTEVAEHIEPTGSKIFVDNLVSAAEGMIIITAAPPGQLGCGHINCQPKEYWIGLFKDKGLTHSIEDEENIKQMWSNTPQYIQDNLMVFK